MAGDKVMELWHDSHHELAAANVTQDDHVVDLCASSEDDEEKPLQQQQQQEPKRRACASDTQSTHQCPEPKKQQQQRPPPPPLTNAAYYVQQAKLASQKRRSKDWSSDENDDDDFLLLNASIGLSRRKREVPCATVVSTLKKKTKLSPNYNKTGGVDGTAQCPLTIDSDDDNQEEEEGAFLSKPVASRKRPLDDDDDSLLYTTVGLSRRPPATRTPTRVRNPYLQTKQPPPTNTTTAASTTMSRSNNQYQYPQLSTTTTLYNDQRPCYLLALWKYGRSHCTRHSFERPRLDQLAKRVVFLAVARPHPIRSMEEYVGGCCSSSQQQQQQGTVQRQLREGGADNCSTPVQGAVSNRRYHSVSEACLVSLLQTVETKYGTNNAHEQRLSDKESWMPLVDLIPLIDAKLLPVCPGRLTRKNDIDFGAEHYLESSTRSMEFAQITKLETQLVGGDNDSGPFIKRHRVRGKVHYELLPVGYKAAQRIRSRTFPEPPGYYRTSAVVDNVQYANVCVGVDRREGGRQSLHKMCDRLDLMKCPYFVTTLSIGDYVFFTNRPNTRSMDLLCPIIVERKSIEDVAMSIYDGRWESQKRRMYMAQYVFGYANCRMVYIIEGNENKQTVSGGYIGARWFNVDIAKLHAEIDNLKQEGFDVLRTCSVENSMFELARWAQRISKELQNGTLRAEYTYAQFKKEVQNIPKGTNFSYMAKDHAQQKMQAERKAETPATTASNGKKKLSLATRMAHAKQAATQPSTLDTQVGDDNKYFSWTIADLKMECEKVGLPKSGGKADLVSRLNGPRPPSVWLERKQAGEYVPQRHNVASTALLVALFLYETDAGLTKDEVYVKAEGLCITKNPFSGGTTQTGPYHYDGWSSMKTLLSGDPALVVLKKKRYKLTRSCSIAGYPLAKALHDWCHEWNGCNCANNM